MLLLSYYIRSFYTLLKRLLVIFKKFFSFYILIHIKEKFWSIYTIFIRGMSVKKKTRNTRHHCFSYCDIFGTNVIAIESFPHLLFVNSNNIIISLPDTDYNYNAFCVKSFLLLCFSFEILSIILNFSIHPLYFYSFF